MVAQQVHLQGSQRVVMKRRTRCVPAICSDDVGDVMGIQRHPLEQKPFWITKAIPRKEQKKQRRIN